MECSSCAGTRRIIYVNEKIFLYFKHFMLMYICSSTLQENVIFKYLNEYFSIDFPIYLTCIYLIQFCKKINN